MRLRLSTFAALGATLILAACGRKQEVPAATAPAPAVAASPGATTDALGVQTAAAPEHLTTVLPAVAGGGADDGAFDPGSARGAADVLKVYYAMVGAKQYRDASVWREDTGPADPLSDAVFASTFDRYATYAAKVGQPGQPQGAAGAVHVSIPVVIHARLKSGAEVTENATVQMHRVNDTPEARGHQISWRIARIDTAK